MYPPLTPDQLAHLPNVISAPRFATYLQARANDRERALALYRWNLEVSAAFMGPLHLCEVAIRNGVSEAIESIHGGAWPWTQGFLRSLPSPQRGYNPSRDLRQTAARHPTTGKVVSDLKFAFWERILTQRFDRSLWQQEFFSSFPGAPQGGGLANARQRYRDDVEKVRLLRNRIAHHEPIFTRNLQDDIDRIVQLVQWRNPVASTWLTSIEPVTARIGRQP